MFYTHLLEAIMSRPFSEIHCVVCRRPVDLNTDLCADENGKAVHEECYLKRITSALLARAWAESYFLLPGNSAHKQLQPSAV